MQIQANTVRPYALTVIFHVKSSFISFCLYSDANFIYK